MLSVLFYRRASSSPERLSNLPTHLGWGTEGNFDRVLPDAKLCSAATLIPYQSPREVYLGVKK